MCVPLIGVGIYAAVAAAMPSLTTIAAGASIAGAGVAAAGAIQQGDTASKASKANAAAQQATATSEENVGAQKAADQEMKAKKMIASQRAGAGAGGVDPSTGTPLTMESQTAEFGELDKLRIINNASRQAWGLQTQADITGYQGSQQQQASYLNAGSTLLGGVSNAYFGSQRMAG
jgi:hypothetical protein